uniref:MIT domain-containing protein n=2 Tax=Parascaris univalens TaxID=6257 RepID=A0A915AP64_PARUN
MLDATMATSEYIDDLFAEAFACFEQGLCYDEIDDSDNAIAIYERGLKLVKEAENAKNVKKSELYKNIIKIRKKVEMRIEELKLERSKITTKKTTTISQDEKSIDNQKDNIVKVELRQQLESISEGEAELIFFIPDGVQLFIIEGDETSVPTYPCPLEIFRFNTQTKSSTSIQAEAFMQVGPWVYPLI